MAAFTAIACNIHNNRAAVRYLAKRSRADAAEHYDVALVSEAHKRRRDLGRLLGHDYLTGPRNGGTGVGGKRLAGNLTQDTGILLARDLPNLGHTYEYLSPAYPQNEQTGHERWANVVTTRLGSTRLTFIALHPLPGRVALRGKNPDNPIVERYLAAIQWLDAEIDKQTALGREVVVGGDIQLQERYNRLWSPKHVFANHKMTWHWHGIDCLAWTPGLELTGRAQVVEKGEWPSDHPLLRARLSVKPRRR
jgi:hypothetical protein